MRFLDTNVLLYAVSKEPNELAKAERAREILGDRDLTLSVQVLQEFFVQATRSTRQDPMDVSSARGLVEAFLRFPVQELTVSLTVAAMGTSERFQISYWDAAIVEAARASGCEVVLSEDLNSGQDYAGVLVQNPFI